MEKLRAATGAAERRPAADRRHARPHRLRIGGRGGEVHRRSRRRPVRVRAQRGHLGGRHGRGNADEPVGEDVRDQHLRTGGADQGAAAVDAGRGPGPIVVVSSAGGVRGMPATAPYSAVKGALERWGSRWQARSRRSVSVSPILVTGTYDTEIITDAGTTDTRDLDGPYAPPPRTDGQARPARDEATCAKSPDKFAAGLAKALDDTTPFVRRPVGPRCANAVDRQPASAGCGHASHDPADDGHPAIRRSSGTSAATMGAPDQQPRRARTWLTLPRSVSNRR